MSDYTLKLAGRQIAKDKTIWSMIKEKSTGKTDRSWIVGSEKEAVIALLKMATVDPMKPFNEKSSILLLLPNPNIVCHIKEANDFENLAVEKHEPDQEDNDNLTKAIREFQTFNEKVAKTSN